jgi:hypothetical protein
MAGTSLTTEQRRIRARAGAFALHASGGTNTRPASAAFLARFEREVDPGRVLSPEERARRAEWARKAYMAKLALKSSRARSNGKAAPVLSTAETAQESRNGRDAPVPTA